MTRMLVTLLCLAVVALGSASAGSAGPQPDPRVSWGIGHANPRAWGGFVGPNPRIGWGVGHANPRTWGGFVGPNPMSWG